MDVTFFTFIWAEFPGRTGTRLKIKSIVRAINQTKNLLLGPITVKADKRMSQSFNGIQMYAPRTSHGKNVWANGAVKGFKFDWLRIWRETSNQSPRVAANAKPFFSVSCTIENCSIWPCRNVRQRNRVYHTSLWKIHGNPAPYWAT